MHHQIFIKVRKILESMITDNGITDLKSSGAKMFLSSGVYGTEKSKDAVIETPMT